jgi:hypothetical protein
MFTWGHTQATLFVFPSAANYLTCLMDTRCSTAILGVSITGKEESVAIQPASDECKEDNGMGRLLTCYFCDGVILDGWTTEQWLCVLELLSILGSGDSNGMR